ncbi:hypothetical protein GMORB2_6127 [Geosmithia morbida]|uniref:NTF2-like protein n=1 Tax=Geosmithia morbida TaxID=1094350 RepID=A0A9P4YUN2_9HYPO|nr:uncharacterized protein GMORB2_6127 [Geosmithia morbida]KAF4123426.1 hypothetical protein GMORB2_6127 [Geosmithia morbida]
MAAIYQQFLASPSLSALADKAALHYLPTTTTISGAEEIVKHFEGLRKHLKKNENVLSAVDGQTSAAFETDTNLEFLISGGPYLPGLDDNFIADRAVSLPIYHFVSLSDDGKISQIRLSWDQASLLRQLDVIGKTGRNWPIRDCKEQITLIQWSVKAAGTGAGTASTTDNLPNRSRGASHATRDPHTTLHMQPTREELENAVRESVVTPYAGKNRPQQRRFEDILGDSPDGQNFDPRQLASPAKAGQGRNHQPMRIFDGQEDHDQGDSPKARPTSQFIRHPNPHKYDHFDFVDGSDPSDAPKAGVSVENKPKSKHDSQWSFDDFDTPVKHKPSKAIRHQDVRHWGTDSESPANNMQEPTQLTAKGRRDAEAHFELQDDGEQVPRQERRPKGAVQNEAMGLYKNKLFDQDSPETPSERTLSNITNLSHRGKDFDAHWEIRDESPMQKENDARFSGNHESGRIHIAGDGMGGKKGTNRDWLYGDDGNDAPTRKPTSHGKDFQSQWEFGGEEEAPKPVRKSEQDRTTDTQSSGRIHIAGDGMGGKKGTNRDWLYGDGGDDAPARKPTSHGKDFQSQWELGGEEEAPKPVKKSEQDRTTDTQSSGRIHIAGDGMGGKKGTNRDWLYGGGEEETPKPAPTKHRLATQSSLWDQ